ncbi:nitrilase-related carbon-nitrogen hydrolase [Ruicaihuangia caeni]|uniref:Nitrilase-related carbon-nitrogen hydrolase n=1 Tax=Ruicaihuangia caeni TaxID=3042517 RepID=A0AAW6T7N5_9MICO|nr:nitrilase-related carbon-nitrogen hydrolase [Klugiella sp. YN-L-19]MDI2098368.1 nitrilase-related carbon-nitrogen hydrolase [Klugiella sp. YN-L-19]
MLRSSLRVEVVQATPAPRDIAANLETTAAMVEASAADVIVFPELFLTGYQTAALEELAMPTTDARLGSLAARCAERETALLVGFIERAAEGYYDAYLAIDADGTILPAVRKTHLFGAEGDVFLAGDSLDPITLCGTPIGVINCFELEFPEVARTLALKGAALLLAGSANMHPYSEDHRIASTARALENRLPVAYANRVGSESGHTFCGFSRIVDRDGSLLGELGEDEQGSLVADLAVNATVPTEVAMLAQRRPELYSG